MSTADTPTDIAPILDSTGIEFLRSTTVSTVDRDADGAVETVVTHLAVFTVEPGSVPDQLAQYGVHPFRPTRLSVSWIDGLLAAVRLGGPRVLKTGLSERETREYEWERPWTFRYHRDRQTPLDRGALPGAVAAAIADYETTVAASTSHPAGLR